MSIPGLKGVKQSARWLRSRFVGRALILGYHRIAEVAPDPYGMCVAPQHFAQQLQVLQKYAHPVSLQELVDGLRNDNLPKRAVAITIDDGYADILHQARPLLEQYQIPATVFVTTGYLGGEFWWDELERMVFSTAKLPERLSLRVNDKIFNWTVDHLTQDKTVHMTTNANRRLLPSLYQQLLRLSSVERQQAMTGLWKQLGDQPVQPSSARAMTPAEVIKLTSGGMVEIGAHTVTHPLLAELPASAQQSEIKSSKTRLEEIVGRPVIGFSYPNGSLSNETLAIVEQAGYNYACASHNDLVWQKSERFNLPRFWVLDRDGEYFSRWLRYWLPN